MTIRTDAVALRRRDLRENDRVYTLYTRELGKVEALARGARKMKSRMAGHLSSFAVVDVMLARGRAVDTLAGSDVIESFPAIMTDPSRLEAALAAISLVDIATKVHAKDQGIFELLHTFFTTIASEATRSPHEIASITSFPRDGAWGGVLAWFCLRLTARLGYAPLLTQCTICRVSRDTYPYFAPEHGGVVCEPCKNVALPAIPITPRALEVLRATIESPLPTQPPRPYRYIRDLVQAHLEDEWIGGAVLAA